MAEQVPRRGVIALESELQHAKQSAARGQIVITVLQSIAHPPGGFHHVHRRANQVEGLANGTVRAHRHHDRPGGDGEPIALAVGATPPEIR